MIVMFFFFFLLSPLTVSESFPIGLGLLSNLRVQCEAGFGTGVLSHIMLSGIEVDRLFCALSLPLICR